jgi:ABC-type sulfate transport system permease subunit
VMTLCTQQRTQQSVPQELIALTVRVLSTPQLTLRNALLLLPLLLLLGVAVAAAVAQEAKERGILLSLESLVTLSF